MRIVVCLDNRFASVSSESSKPIANQFPEGRLDRCGGVLGRYFRTL